MRFQGKSTITPPPPIVTVSDGGTTTSESAGTWYAALLTRTSCGFSRTGTAIQFALNAGQRISAVVPGTVRTEASDVQRVYLVLSRENTLLNSARVACVYGYHPVTDEEISFPQTISLSEDEHFILDGFVSETEDLPDNPVIGQLRHLASVGHIVEWSAVADGEEISYEWVKSIPQRISGWVESSIGIWGCDQDLRSIPETLPLNFKYSQFKENKRSFLLFNDTGNAISEGKRLILTFFKDGEDVSGAYGGQMIVTVRGYTNLTSHSLDTVDLTTGEEIVYETQTVYWLEKDLPDGWGLLFDVRFEYEPSATPVHARPNVNSKIEIYAKFGERNSDFSPDAGALGSYIFQGLLVLPAIGLYPILSGGRGRVEPYNFKTAAQTIAGLAVDTEDQKIVLTQNAVAYVASTVPSTARLCAVVSTKNSVGRATEWVSVSVSANNIIQLQMRNATRIRDDYPDIVAGESATVNTNLLRVYIKSGSSIGYWDVVVSGTATETILVGGINPTSIAELPTVDNKIGLFAPEIIALSTVSGASALSTGTKEICIAYRYENTVTEVNHSRAIGCIARLGGSSIVDTIYDSKFWKSSVADIDLLRELPADQLGIAHVRLVEGESMLAVYSASPPEGVEDDGIFVVIPEEGGCFFLQRKAVVIDTKGAIKDICPANLVDGQQITCSENSALYFYTSDFDYEDDDEIYLSCDDDDTKGFIKISGQSEGGTGIAQIDSVTNLKALSTANLTEPLFIFLKEKDSIYRLDKTSSTGNDNNRTISSNSGGSRWIKTGERGLDDAQATKLEKVPSDTIAALEGKAPSNHNHAIENVTNLVTTIETLQTNINTKLTKPGTISQNGSFVTVDTNGTTSAVVLSQTATTNTTEGFTQPAIGGTILVKVGNGLQFVVGEYISMSGGGLYEVSDCTSDSLTLINRNTPLSSAQSPGTFVASGKLVVHSGRPGSDGVSAQTLTGSSEFQIPAVNATVAIEVITSAPFVVEDLVKIEDAGTFKVVSIDTPTQITIRNVDSPDVLASPGTPIVGNRKIKVAGQPGLLSSGAFLGLIQQSSDTAAVSGKTVVFAKTDNNVYIRSPGQSAKRLVTSDDEVILDSDGVRDALEGLAEGDRLNSDFIDQGDTNLFFTPDERSELAVDLAAINTTLGQKAPSSHNHAIGDVTGLTEALENASNGSGAQTFLEMTDTPDSYSGQALKIPRVNAAENAIEFVTAPSGGSSVIFKHNGVTLTNGVTSIDLVGDGAEATNNGNNITITINAGEFDWKTLYFYG